jgi:hypothetical protein
MVDTAKLTRLEREQSGLFAASDQVQVCPVNESERETANLLKSEAMKRRLLRAKQRRQGLSLDQAVEKLGI